MLTLIQHICNFCTYPVLALFISLVLTFVCIGALPKLGFVDKPGERRIHKGLIPRGGGIAVMIAFFATIFFYTLSSGADQSKTLSLFWILFWPSIILGTLGIIDDRWEMKSYLKLLVQIIVVLIIWFSGDFNYTIYGWQIPWYLSLAAVGAWVIIIINAFNLIDGLDGLATGLSIVSATCMGVWFVIIGNHSHEATIMFILVGACLGFLRYNFHPAKIFLGDTGSTFLGLIFAIMGLSTITPAVTATSLILPLLAVGVPIFDVVLAIWRRTARKVADPKNNKGIMSADQDHLHHRLLRKNEKQHMVAIYMYSIASIFCALVIFILVMRDTMPALVFFIFIATIIFAVHHLAHVELSATLNAIQNGVKTPAKRLIVVIAQPFYDYLAISMAFIISFWVIFDSFHYFNAYVALFIVTSVSFHIMRIYKRYWIRAIFADYIWLAITILLSCLISCIVCYFFCYPTLQQTISNMTIHNFVAASILYTLLTIVFIFGERLLLNYAESFGLRMLELKEKKHDENIYRAVIYGGGMTCRLLIKSIFSISKRQNNISIVGIIDDNVSLHGYMAYGFNVLGSIRSLDKIYEKTKFNKIILTIDDIKEEKMSKLKEFCKTNNIVLTKFDAKEHFIDE